MLLSQRPGRKGDPKGPSQHSSVSQRQQNLLKRAGGSWWLNLRRAFPQTGRWKTNCDGLKNKDEAEGCTSLNRQTWGERNRNIAEDQCWARTNTIFPDLCLCPFSHVSHHRLSMWIVVYHCPCLPLLPDYKLLCDRILIHVWVLSGTRDGAD